MKKLFISLLFLSVLVACDKVNHPNQRPPQLYNCIDTVNQVINTNAGTDGKAPDSRKVLLEDFTGHYCPNCPRAGKTAEGLIEQYPNLVIVIAHHVTDQYAKVSKDTTNKYKENFQNPASTEWDSKTKGFSISGAGLPQGMVNRGGNPDFAQADSKWPSLVSTALGKPQSARLDVKTYYDTSKHYLSVNVKTTFKIVQTNAVNVQLVLTQDGIVACQKDGNASNAPNDRDPDESQTRLHYEFDHIVIDAMNSPQGQLVKAGPIAVNDTASVFASCYLLNKCFGVDNSTTFPAYTAYCIDDNHVNLVAFVYDVVTKEVLQVEKVKIR